jgi:hypothetical protein
MDLVDMLRSAQADELVTVYATPNTSESRGSHGPQQFLLEAHTNPEDGSLMWCPITAGECPQAEAEVQAGSDAQAEELQQKRRQKEAHMLAHLRTKKWMGKKTA